MIYKPSQREQAIIFIDKMFAKKKWIKIEHIPESKTMNQLRYIWLVFTIVADDTGNEPQDIYEYYLDRFPIYKEITILDEEKKIRISLSQFSIEQASYFIDKVVIDARQEGHVIPDPQDKAALEAYNYYKSKGLI